MKFFKAMFIGFLVVSLAACGMGQQTAKEVITQAAKSGDSVKSLAMTMKAKEKIETNGQTLNATISMQEKATKDPVTMHANLTVDTQGRATKIEMYLGTKGAFAKMPNQQWVKLPENLSSQILKIPQKEADPLKKMKKLKQYADDFSLKKEDGNYILKLSASGNKFMKLLKDHLNNTMPEGLNTEQTFKNSKLNKIQYTIVLDGKTYYPQSLKIKADMNIQTNGHSAHIVMDSTAAFSKYNEIDQIKVPKKVLDHAKSIPAGNSQ